MQVFLLSCWNFESGQTSVLSISSDSGIISFHLSNHIFLFMFIMRRQNIIIDRLIIKVVCTFTSSSDGCNFKVTLQS